MNSLMKIVCLALLFGSIVCPPVDKDKGKEPEKKEKSSEETQDDDFGLEYGRYLQQVVQALEEDKEFAKKLENISTEQIRNGQIAHELEFVKHNVRTKLDELKRIELDRIRNLLREQLDRTELGAYSDDDRRWRTIPGHRRGFEGLDRKGVKLPDHLDIHNPHSFEIGDLKRLIQTATKDLEALDKQRKEEFKKYELEKEYSYRESLKNMTEDQKKETEKHHDEMLQKHKDHPKVHHPGSKPQLEQVWEEEDHMPKAEFNPRTFFAMHDINEDGHLDEKEIEALLMPEVRKMYDPKNEEDDPAEMEEEYHRMREHIFNETDNNKDGLISLEEFMRMTQQKDFEQDDGWQGLDEQSVYSEAELEEYMRQRHLAMQNQGYGDPRMYYDVPHAQGGMPPHVNYPQPHGAIPPQQQQQQYHQPVYPQHGQQQQFQGVPPQHQQQFQGVPPQHQQQFQGVPPQHQQFQGAQHQQQFQGVPQHQQQFQGAPEHQQQFQGVPPQQQYQAVPQQQQHRAVPPQQQFQGVPPQQQFQGVPPQQQFQGVPPQQQNIPPQAVPQPPKPAEHPPNTGFQPNVNQGGNVNSPSTNLPSSAPSTGVPKA